MCPVQGVQDVARKKNTSINGLSVLAKHLDLLMITCPPPDVSTVVHALVSVACVELRQYPMLHLQHYSIHTPILSIECTYRQF